MSAYDPYNTADREDNSMIEFTQSESRSEWEANREMVNTVKETSKHGIRLMHIENKPCPIGMNPIELWLVYHDAAKFAESEGEHATAKLRRKERDWINANFPDSDWNT